VSFISLLLGFQQEEWHSSFGKATGLFFPGSRGALDLHVVPGYRPAAFDDIPITAIVTMETAGTGTRYVFTALHR